MILHRCHVRNPLKADTTLLSHGACSLPSSNRGVRPCQTIKTASPHARLLRLPLHQHPAQRRSRSNLMLRPPPAFSDVSALRRTALDASARLLDREFFWLCTLPRMCHNWGNWEKRCRLDLIWKAAYSIQRTFEPCPRRWRKFAEC
jgi:hypothetical protein